MKLNFLLISFLVVFLSACQQDVQSQNAQQSKPALTETIHAAKSHVPVTMQFKFLTPAELNKTLEVRLEFKVGRSTENLQVVYRAANSSLNIADAQSQYEFYNLPAGASETIIAKVIPVQPGKHVIYISASMDIDGVMQSSAFEVPVNVGSINQLKTNNSSTPKGMTHIPEQNVISMPATETKN